VVGQGFSGVLLGSLVFFLAPEYSSRFPIILDAGVDDVWDSSWRCCFMVWLYFAAKPSHMRVDVDGLACPCTVLWPATIR
jgi:hypothetical protein